MKYLILVVLFLLCVSFCLYAEGHDIVVLLDTSKSVFSYFDSLLNYLINEVLICQIKYGNTFHLLTFSGTTEKELITPINDKEDIEQIVSDVLLLQAFGDYTDLIGALRFLQNYVAALEGENSKSVIIITDGIHDPPPGSETSNLSTVEEVSTVKNTARAIKENAEDVNLIQLPSDEDGSGVEPEPTLPQANDGKKRRDAEDYMKTLSDELEIPIQQFKKSDENDKKATKEQIGKSSRPGTPESKDLPRTDRQYRNDNNMKKQPQSGEESEEEQDFNRESPRTEDEQQPQKNAESNNTFMDDDKSENGQAALKKHRFSFSLLIGILAAGVAGSLLMFLIVRKAVIEGVFSTIRKKIRFFTPNENAIELYVFGQNPNIGMRNVHIIQKGRSRCVGGKNSDYLIFLIPLPKCVAALLNKNGDYELHIRKNSFFPNTEPVVHDCINKRIQLVSPTGREVYFVFRIYISKLERINRIMRLVETPGPVDLDFIQKS